MGGGGGGVHVCMSVLGEVSDGRRVPILASPALFPHAGEGSSGVTPAEQRQAAWTSSGLTPAPRLSSLLGRTSSTDLWCPRFSGLAISPNLDEVLRVPLWRWRFVELSMTTTSLRQQL